jgi:hypothetical protein
MTTPLDELRKVIGEWRKHYEQTIHDCADQLESLLPELEREILIKWNEGFELAHELRTCGHSRGDLRDDKYVPGVSETCESVCVGCQREADAVRAREMELLAARRVQTVKIMEAIEGYPKGTGLGKVISDLREHIDWLGKQIELRP